MGKVHGAGGYDGTCKFFGLDDSSAQNAVIGFQGSFENVLNQISVMYVDLNEFSDSQVTTFLGG